MNLTLAAYRHPSGIVVRTLLPALLALLALASAGSAAELEGADLEWYEQHRMLMSSGETDNYQRKSPTWREDFRGRFWGSMRGEGLFPGVPPEERQRVWEKRVTYAGEAFAGEASAEEGVTRNGWETLRGIVFLFVGPPQARYVSEESYPAGELEIEDIEALKKHLAKDVPEAQIGGDDEPSGGGGGIMNLDFGNLSFGGESEETDAATEGKVERWAYAIPGSPDVRVFTFADPDGNGALGLLLDERLPARKLARTGEEHRYDFGWFPQAAMLAADEIQDVPEIHGEVGPAGIGAFTFRSADPARTHVRFLSSLDRASLEAAGLDPEPFLSGKADVYLSVRNATGAWVEQRVLKADDGYERRGDDPVLVAIPSEVPPGAYRAEVLHVYDGKGVRGETDIRVPDYAGRFGMSTPLLTVATEPLPPDGDGLKKVKRSKAASRKKKKKDDAEAKTGQTGGFLYGRYEIVPVLDRSMKPGDVMAVYIQVYNCVEGSVAYEFFVDGESMGEWEPDAVTPSVSEFVRFQPLTDEFPEGEYEIQIRAEDAATGEKVEGAVRFQFEL